MRPARVELESGVGPSGKYRFFRPIPGWDPRPNVLSRMPDDYRNPDSRREAGNCRSTKKPLWCNQQTIRLREV